MPSEPSSFFGDIGREYFPVRKLHSQIHEILKKGINDKDNSLAPESQTQHMLKFKQRKSTKPVSRQTGPAIQMEKISSVMGSRWSKGRHPTRRRQTASPVQTEPDPRHWGVAQARGGAFAHARAWTWTWTLQGRIAASAKWATISQGRRCFSLAQPHIHGGQGTQPSTCRCIYILLYVSMHRYCANIYTYSTYMATRASKKAPTCQSLGTFRQ